MGGVVLYTLVDGGNRLGENLEGVDDVKTEYKAGRVYSGYYCRTYIVFEITEHKYESTWVINVTYSGDEEVMKEGARLIYKNSNLFQFGDFQEVATDYKQAQIDLLLDLKQMEWLKELVR